MPTISIRDSFSTSFMGPEFFKGLPPYQHGIIPMIASASGHARQLNGNIITNNTIAPSDSSMSHMLWQAAYDSKSNQDQDYCYKGTRVGLLDKILSEINSYGSGGLIWLTGPAGFGKSAIAKSICLALDHTKRNRGDFESFSHEYQFGASYFFRRADTERSNVNKMIFTVAQQLSKNIDGFRSQSIEYQEQEIAQMESETLFESIVKKPLEKLSRRRIAIVIDALDECTTSWETVVDLFSQLRDLPESSACVRIIFTSRPQPRIQYAFHSLRPKLIVDLDDEDIVRSSQKDISIFLKEEFKDILARALHSSVQASPTDCIEVEWPSREDFQRAVSLATTPKPLFIYAVTMCRFVGSDNAEPRNRLQQWLCASREVTSSTTTSSGMQNQLFSMYRIFFHEVESHGLTDSELDQLRSVLHGVLVVGNNLPMKGLLQLLGYDSPGQRDDGSEPKELFLLRRNFQPILDIPEDMGQDSVLQVYHKSLIDFLEQARPDDSKFYPINNKRSGIELGLGSLAFLSNVLSQNQEEIDECDAQVAKYAFHHWPSFLLQAADEIDDQTLEILTGFLKHDFLASFRLSQGIHDAKGLSDALCHLSERQNSLLLKDAANLLREISSLDFINKAGEVDKKVAKYLSPDFLGSFKSRNRIHDVKDLADALIHDASKRKYGVFMDVATEVSEFGSIHLTNKSAVADDYSTAFTFCPPSSSLMENAQRWQKPRARCQTSSLRECGKPYLIPRSARFSRDSTVFVAQCSDRMIHCWVRTHVPSNPNSPDELGWNPTHVCGPTPPGIWYGPFGFTLSAAGNTMAYNTSTGIEVWGTQTGYNRHFPHPPRSKAKLQLLTLSEDGKYLAACYKPKGPGFARVRVWTVANLCASRRSSPSISRLWPSHRTSFLLKDLDGNLAGMTFSPTGDRLAILSILKVGNGDTEFPKINRVSHLAVHIWDTKTWKSLTSTHRSRQIPTPAGHHNDTRAKYLNFTFSRSDEIAILWQTHSLESEEYFHQVEFLKLARTDDVESAVVDLSFNALNELRLNPEPFWVEGDEINVSHGYFRTSPCKAKVVESLCFFKNFRFSDRDVERRRLYGRSGISYNDRRFLWIPWAYNFDDLFACGRHTFAVSESGNGNLKFIEMAMTKDQKTEQQ